MWFYLYDLTGPNRSWIESELGETSAGSVLLQTTKVTQNNLNKDEIGFIQEDTSVDMYLIFYLLKVSIATFTRNQIISL